MQRHGTIDVQSHNTINVQEHEVSLVPPANSAGVHLDTDVLEERFVNQPTVFPFESDMPVHARWSNVLGYIPMMRGRHLYQDLSDIYAAALKTATGPTLVFTYDLTVLQNRFWSVLYVNRFCSVGTYAYWRASCDAWMLRLSDKICWTRGWRRTKRGKVRPPCVRSQPLPVPFRWQH